jgi:hypothetical protein
MSAEAFGLAALLWAGFILLASLAGPKLSRQLVRRWRPAPVKLEVPPTPGERVALEDLAGRIRDAHFHVYDLARDTRAELPAELAAPIVADLDRVRALLFSAEVRAETFRRAAGSAFPPAQE